MRLTKPRRKKPMKLRHWLPFRSELHVAYFDLRAWAGGWCNDCPARSDHTGANAAAATTGCTDL